MFPVELTSLAKTESATDFSVALPGDDFVWSRSYSSFAGYAPEMLGHHWFSNAFYYVTGNSSAVKVVGQTSGSVEFIDPGSGPLRPRGRSPQEMHIGESLSGYPGESMDVDVFRLIDPGKWEIDFYDTGSSGPIPTGAHGYMLQYRDAYGNTRTYEYTTLSNILSSDNVRLSKIYLNGTEDPDGMTDPSDAVIELTWFDIDPGNPLHDGHLDRVDVKRNDGFGNNVVTQWVDYDYATELEDEMFTVSDDVAETSPCGTSVPLKPLLVQVSQGTLVDSVPTSLSDVAGGNYYVRYTHYRYHNNCPAVDDDYYPTDPALANGRYGALKSIIMPEQIEYLAQQLNDDATGGGEPEGSLGKIGEATYLAAIALLAEDDNSDTFDSITVTGITPMTLASKIVSYNGDDTNIFEPVAVQWLQADCGCGGGSSASFRRFEYTNLYLEDMHDGPGLASLATDANAIARTVKIEEYEGTGSTLYREHRYDLVFPRGDGSGSLDNGPAYVVAQALRDHSLYGSANMQTDNNWWVWWYDHHFENDNDSHDYGKPGALYDLYAPSAMAEYTPAVSTTPAAEYDPVMTDGLVHRFEYASADRRKLETSIGTFASSTLTFTPYEKITYLTTNDTTKRTYLPEKIERNRTGIAWATMGNEDQIETIKFSYLFDDPTTMAMKLMKVSVEAELVAENGPGVQTYDYTTMFDDRGQLVWTIDQSGTLDYRDYDATTGAPTTVIRNADPLGSDSSNPAFGYSNYGFGSQISGTNSSGGDLESTTGVDLLGRWVTRTSPGGVITNVRREVVADSLRVGVAYMSNLILPHKLAGTTPVEFDGPASRSWLNAAGKSTRSSSYAIDGTQTYTPTNGTFTLLAELTRVATFHDIHGNDTAMRRWHDIAANAYDEWTTEYDSFGRIEMEQDSEETKTLYEYDALDRPIEMKISSTEMGATEVTVSEIFYDSDMASQGIGNGNIGLVVLHTQEPSSGGLSSTMRTFEHTYDYRDRLIGTESPEAPHHAYAYDNLNRLIGLATFSAASTSVGSSTNRGWLSYRSYSQRGMLYRTTTAINASSSTPDFLQSDTWFDAEGRVIKSLPHSSPAMKYVYDGLDRVTTAYLTDAKGDAKPGNSGNHAAADDVTGDTVVEQTIFTYSMSPDEEDGSLDLVEFCVRSHDSTATGAISGTDCVASWVGYAYDDADRMTHRVNFGTTLSTFQTGGTDPMTGMSPVWPPSSPPSATSGTFSSDDYIVTEMTFNTRGLVDEEIDPTGDVTKYLYDDASRVIAVIEAYDDATLATTPFASGRWQFEGLDDDEDRVTSYVYNGIDQVVRLVAHLPDGSGGDEAQVTEYTYGVTAAVSGVTDSLVYDNRLLRKVVYPDESTGAPGSGGTYTISYSYNALGELRSVTDQNGTLHAYERDDMGRVTADRVDDIVSADIDDTVLRIGIDYDSFGRVSTVESLDDETSGVGSVVNGVTYEYTALWQVSKMHQDMDGVASKNGTGGTETVEYTYSTAEFDGDAMSIGAHNYTRLDHLIYPSDSTVSPTMTVRYGSVGTVNNVVSRAVGFNADGVGTLALYEHVGWDRIAEVDYAAPDVQLDRTFSHEGKRNTQGYSSQSAGVYPGWDRFGRVRVQAWVDGDLDVKRSGQGSDPNANVPGIPPIIEELQLYDRASNRLGKIDARPGAKRPNRDYDMAYDSLDRLAEARRGSWDDAYTQTTWTQTGTAIGNSEAWTYDALGNWNEFLTDGNFNNDFADTGSGAGYVDLAETRSHNMANELSDIDENQGVGGVDLSFLYDDAGNRTKKTYVSGVGYDTFIYDAWNRLVKITRTDDEETTTDVSVYTYNGQHFRITEVSGDQTREMYYGTLWQLLEEHIDEPGETPDREVQHFWGKRYIDDAIMHRTRESGEETWASSDSFYHLTDPMYSTLAIIDDSANLMERVYYSSYGVPSATRRADIDGDGDVDATDLSYLAVSDIADVGTNTNYTVEFDVDRDGDVDVLDYSVWTVENSMAPLGPGVLSDPSSVDNRTGYDGYRWEPETLLWHVRHRAYDSYTGRWLQRDPEGYVDSLNIYIAALSSPLVYVDPLGLQALPLPTPIWTPRLVFPPPRPFISPRGPGGVMPFPNTTTGRPFSGIPYPGPAPGPNPYTDFDPTPDPFEDSGLYDPDCKHNPDNPCSQFINRYKRAENFLRNYPTTTGTNCAKAQRNYKAAMAICKLRQQADACMQHHGLSDNSHGTETEGKCNQAKRYYNYMKEKCKKEKRKYDDWEWKYREWKNNPGDWIV